jgi:protein involved in sex pheromone biosynthesis
MVYLNDTIYLNFIKDIKMKTITSSHSLQSKLWIALLVSVVGLSACSNEVEETPDNTMNTTEATAVEKGPTDTEVGTDTALSETTTDMGMAETASPMDPAGTATTDTMTDSTTTDEMTDGAITSDTTMVDEENTSFNQDPVESAQ